jgi:hypothetical protein
MRKPLWILFNSPLLSFREEENRKLHDKVQELTQELEAQKAEQADVYFYLHKKLDDNYDVIAGLERNILELQTEKDRNMEDYEKQMDEEKSISSSKIAALNEKVDEQAERLAALTDFAERKEEIETSLKELGEGLEAEKLAHENDVNNLNRRNVQDKERLKTEMEFKIKETREKILAETEDQLHTTTKRTILENEQMSTELQYQSRETEKLLQKHNFSIAENGRLRRDVEIATQTQLEMAKKTQFYQKLIKNLHEKVQQQEDSLRTLSTNTAPIPSAVTLPGLPVRGGRSQQKSTSRRSLEHAQVQVGLIPFLPSLLGPCS